MDSDVLSRILQWCSSIAKHIDVCEEQLDNCDNIRPPLAKRVRLDDYEPNTTNEENCQELTDHLPSPSVSELLPYSAPMASSSAKRPREENTDGPPSLDLTPRPNRFAVVDDYDSNSVASTTSSKVSKISRTSSPTKQIIHAELQPTGFRQSSFAFDSQPQSLQLLCCKLRKTYLGDGILHSSLLDEVRVAFDSVFKHQLISPSTRRSICRVSSLVTVRIMISDGLTPTSSTVF